MSTGEVYGKIENYGCVWNPTGGHQNGPFGIELQKQKEVIETITVVTAQHRQMLDQVLETFNIVPDYDLDIMGKSQTLLDITSKILNQLDPVIKKKSRIWCSSMEIRQPPLRRVWLPLYNQVRIGHVEAGLRTFDKYSPYPEEMNRQMTDDLGICILRRQAKVRPIS